MSKIDQIKKWLKSKATNPLYVGIITALVASWFSTYGTYYYTKKIELEKFTENKIKIQQIINAEIFENLTISSQYANAKNQIISDVEFVSFIQKDRFYTSSLRDLLVNNFQYLDNSDLYYLAIARDKLNALNDKLDILENSRLSKPPISQKIECNFRYFLPEEKYSAHRYLNDDFNRFINSVKKISFFSGNEYENLNEYFDLTDTQVGLYYLKYNEEYKEVGVNCD